MTVSGKPTGGDLFTVEQIVLVLIPHGQTFTIDDVRPSFQLAGINPKAFGPLLYGVMRLGVIERVDTIHRTRKVGYNGGQRGVWRRCLPAGHHGAPRP